MDAGRSNRAMKVGIAYEVEKKMEDNYDREEEAGTPKAVVDWVKAIVTDGGACEDYEWKTINTWMRDGVLLCKLINCLLKADGKQAVSFQKKVLSPFVAMTNIENFNKGCETYGLAKESTFQSGDLWEVRKGPFLNVINCLHSLGFVANSKQFMPVYLGEISKTIDRE